MTARAKLVTSVLPLLLIAGCYSGDAPIQARGEAYDLPWLTLGSTQLRGDIRVGDAVQTRDESGILHVVIPVRGTIDRQLYVDYLVSFYDAAGSEINHVPGNLTIPAHGMRRVEANSTSPRAQSFHVELNYPRVN